MPTRAPYAADPALSRGRVFAPEPSPTRSEFQRDRDRIIHSTAFRRLQHKTQVFLHHEGQHYRTRLTHTLEVSQMARAIARALGLDEDLAEAVALAHDLGHTPFGHAGERVLDRQLAPWGGFDHNVQALRVVTVLENRYADHDGLNLSWETLEGMLKHNGPVAGSVSGEALGQLGQLGFLPEGLDLEPSTHAGLEAQAAAIADDIAYNAHDIDDALRAGLLTFEALREAPMVGPILAEVDARWPELEPPRRAHEVQRRMITRAIEDVIATAEQNIHELAPNNVEDVRHCGRVLVEFSPALRQAEQGLKSFLFANVYRHPQVMRPVGQSETVVAALFDRYMETADMPGRWGWAAEASDEAGRARVVADFIAGMTDPYALGEYERLFDARPDFR